MKESNYNYFIPRNDKIICYNTMQDSMVIISSSAYDMFKKSIEELMSSDIKVYNSLLENGFIIDDDLDEYNQLMAEYHSSVNSEDDMLITIYPTQDCNLKCWYCFETHVPKSKMSENTRTAIFMYIKNRLLSESPKRLRITFFGGEPLMYFNEVAYKLSCDIKKCCDSLGIEFITFFITNGSLLNAEMVTKLDHINATFQITIDGCREKHDTVKIGKKNNHPTYDTVIKGIHLIAEKIHKSKQSSKVITVRINYDNETLSKIDEILKYLEDLPRDKVAIHLERVWQTIGNIGEEQRNMFVTAYRKLIHAGFSVSFGSFGRKRVSCPAEQRNYVVINYDARIYRCNGRTLIPQDSEGVIDSDGNIIWNEKKECRMIKPTFEYKQCKECKNLPICMGPCSQKCIEKNWENLADICTLQSIDLPFEDYILLRCEQLLILKADNR